MNSSAGKGKDKLFNLRPALFAAFFLIFGILFAYYRELRGVSYLWLLLLIPVGVLPLCFAESGRAVFKRAAVMIAFFLVFAVGFISFRFQMSEYQDCPRYSGTVVVTATVSGRSQGERGVVLVLEDARIGEERVEGRLNAYLSSSFEEEFRIADVVLIQGEITTNTELESDFGFRAEQIGRRQRYYISNITACTKVDRSTNLFLRIRSRMEAVVYQGMDDTPAALTMALLTGDCTGVDEDLMNNMRYGGIIHIFAVSGLNIGALFGFCLLLFTKTPLRKAPKPARFILVGLIVFLYTGVCGFTASVVRAAILCMVGYFAKLLGTGSDLLEGLGIVAISMLLLIPSDLFAVGFQLSFLACLGLALLTRPIGQVFDEVENAFRKRHPRKLSVAQWKMVKEGDTLPPTVGEEAWRWCKSVVCATLAAQIMTAPALMIEFGYLSGWAILLNLVFVPFIDAAFTVLLVIVMIACCLPLSISGVLLYVPSMLWSAALLLFEVADFSSFMLEGVSLSVGACICYFAGLIFYTDKCNLTLRMKRVLRIGLFLGFFAAVALQNL